MPQLQIARAKTAPALNRKQRRAKKTRTGGAASPLKRLGGAHGKGFEAVRRKLQGLLENGEYAKLVEEAQQVLGRFPQEPELYMLLGRGCEQLGQLMQAYNCFKKAVDLAPDAAEGWQHLGRVLHNGNRFEASEVALERCLSIQPKNPETLKLLALARYALGDSRGGLRACDQALSLKPDWDQAFYIRGLLYKSTGNYGEARKALKHAHKLNPEMINALFELVDITEPDQLDALVEKLNVFQEDSLDDPRKISALHFSLARVHRLRKEYDEAFAHYRSANNAGKQVYSFDRGSLRKAIDQAIAAFDPDLFKERNVAGSSSSRPIFIVGMPRSGTSLTEQIVSSHRDVFGAGESYVLKAIAEALENSQGNHLSYPADVAKIDASSLSSLADEYLSRIDRICPADTLRFTDKMVFNFLHLGLIALLFPNASIIHCMRDPVDTCLSCYFQRFDSGNQLSFTFDLDDLGFYYREYHRLMAHWRNVLPMPVLDVQYEKLIVDHETESRRILDFLKLDWDDACLNFHEQERAVLTASVVQARQPIYQTAAGRWRHYEKHLGPLLDALGDLAHQES